MITEECLFMVGHLGICDQFAVMTDVIRRVRQRLGPGIPPRWDVLLVRPGVVRMVGYRV